MSILAVHYKYTRQVVEEMAAEIGEFGRPYLRRIVVEWANAGVPTKTLDHLEYAFVVLMERPKEWKGLSPKAKGALSAMNGVVSADGEVPNYSSKTTPHPEQMDAILKGMTETAEWLLGPVADNLRGEFQKILTRNAAAAAKENTTYTVDRWKEEILINIKNAPGSYPGGNRVAEILFALL